MLSVLFSWSVDDVLNIFFIERKNDNNSKHDKNQYCIIFVIKNITTTGDKNLPLFARNFKLNNCQNRCQEPVTVANQIRGSTLIDDLHAPPG